MKIFLSILFLILLIVLLCGLFVVLFMVFIPFLKKKGVEVTNPLFSDYDVVQYDSTVLPPDSNPSKRAVVMCSAERNIPSKRMEYEGRKDCSLFNSIYDGEGYCSWGCIGFGNCIKACPKNAIVIKNNTAFVTGSCNGCGKCVDSCPQNLIKLISVKKNECKLCTCPENCSGGCTMQGKTSTLLYEERKDFQFWQKCYKMVNRK